MGPLSDALVHETAATTTALRQVLGKSWEKDEAMAWTAVMALLTHAAEAIYKEKENAQVELAGAGEVEVSSGTSAQAAEKGHLIDTRVDELQSMDGAIHDITNKMATCVVHLYHSISLTALRLIAHAPSCL